MSFKIDHSDKLTLAPQSVIKLAHEGCNALVQSDLVFPRALFSMDWDSRVMYATDDVGGDVVGITCFKLTEHRRSWYVSLSYVEPSSRRRGVYRALWSALLERARAEKIDLINSATHANNTEMLEINRRLGKKVLMVEYEFMV